MELADIIRNRLREAEGRVSNLREQLTEAEQEAQSWRLVLPLEIQRKERRGGLEVTVPLATGANGSSGHQEGVGQYTPQPSFEDLVVMKLQQVNDIVTAAVLAAEMEDADAHRVSAALSHLYKKGRVDRVGVSHKMRGSRYAYLSKAAG